MAAGVQEGFVGFFPCLNRIGNSSEFISGIQVHES
jgi:hypothetical protein